MKILVDCDGVLADLVSVLCRLLTEKFGRAYTHEEDFKVYSFKDNLTAEEFAHIEKAFEARPYCRILPWYPGAPHFLRWLQSKGRVQCVTRPFHTTGWKDQRKAWLSSFFHPDDVIFAHNKNEVEGEILIEDCTENANAWAEHHKKPVILMTRPWNQDDETGSLVFRASTFAQAQDLVDLFIQIEKCDLQVLYDE